IEGEGEWRGTGLGELAVNGRASTEAGRLQVGVERQGEAWRWVQAAVLHEDATVLELVEPARIETGEEGWRVENLVLRGSGLSVAAANLSQTAGELEWQLENADLTWIGDWW